MRVFVFVALAIFGALGVTGAAPAEPMFTGLGDLPGGWFDSKAHAVSPDGSTVVGISNSGSSDAAAFYWNASEGMTFLGGLPGSMTSAAYGVSTGGRFIVGNSSPPAEAFRWSETSGFQSLGGILAYAFDVTPDGSVVIGRQGPPFLWTEDSGIVHLSDRGGSAFAVSADGAVVVGYRRDALFRDEAFRWTASGGDEGLGFLPGDDSSLALDVSADGTVVVGRSGGSLGDAFRWTEESGMVAIERLPGRHSGTARGVSADGSIVVGDSGQQAFIWDSENGTRDLKTLLEGDFGLDLTGWSLTLANDVSADGRTIVGWGNNPSGDWEAWIAVLPEPSIPVEIDIKPGSCPNSWNRNSNGVLPVAILGTEDFDVTLIDVASITISRADGTRGSVGPNEGPPGPHSVFEDVGTPFDGEVCDCHEAEGDGIPDLSIKFRTQDVADLFPVDELDGAMVPLVVSGKLLDGTPFTSTSDCVRLVPPGSLPNQVTVQSLAGAWTDATPLDNQLDGGGFGSFQRTYPHTTVLTLTGPSSHNGYPFVGWKLDGGDLVQGRSITLVVNNAEHTAKAVFKKVNGCGLGFELVFVLPALIWLQGRRRRRMQ